MDLNHYVEGKLIEFLDVLHTFLKARLAGAYGDDWFDKGVKPHINPKYVDRTKEMLSHPLRTVDMGKTDEELYGIEHIQNVLRGNLNLFEPWFRDCDRASLYLAEVAEVRHNISHRRGHHLLSASSARHCLDACGILLRAIQAPQADDFQTAADAISQGSFPWGPGLENGLPAREIVVTDFVGRTREISELYEWFRSRDTNRWVVWGDGGAGKSAVAYEFATRIRDSNPAGYVAVGWVSAKSEQFTDGQVQPTSPDFTDMPTAVEAMLISLYPWHLDDNLSNAEAERRLLRAMNEMPALIVVDDVDTVLEDEALIEFLTFRLPQQKCKLLFTSRSKLPGLRGTEVRGFEGDELIRFLQTRCRIFAIPVEPVLAQVQQIQSATRGYPLYVEDLLRLSTVEPLKDAIADWGKRRGDAARGYALRRQVSRLEEGSKDALIAVCLARSPLSLAELANVVGRKEEDVEFGLRQLQRSFLIFPPRVVDGVPRFEANTNTQRLVETTFGKDDSYRAIKAAIVSLRGELKTLAASKSIASFIRQARLLVDQRAYDEAEDVIKGALGLHPEDPDLYGGLGWVYKANEPRRIEDARRAFERAHQLGAAKIDTYWHWAMMEADADEWQLSAGAAERGLERQPGNRELLFRAGYARNRIGRQLSKQFQFERAEAELLKAEAHLKAALAASVLTDREVPKARIFRALVLTYESLEKWDSLVQSLHRWEKEDPDWYLETERDRLRHTYEPVRAALQKV